MWILRDYRSRSWNEIKLTWNEKYIFVMFQKISNLIQFYKPSIVTNEPSLWLLGHLIKADKTSVLDHEWNFNFFLRPSSINNT